MCGHILFLQPLQDLGEAVLVCEECRFRLIEGPIPIFALININAGW